MITIARIVRKSWVNILGIGIHCCHIIRAPPVVYTNLVLNVLGKDNVQEIRLEKNQ